jgi:hypothetical protein
MDSIATLVDQATARYGVDPTVAQLISESYQSGLLSNVIRVWTHNLIQ